MHRSCAEANPRRPCAVCGPAPISSTRAAEPVTPIWCSLPSHFGAACCDGSRSRSHEKYRISVLRTLVADPRQRREDRCRRADTVDRTGRGRRGAGARRGLFPGAPFRPAACLALPASGRRRCPHLEDRDRHRRDRHALREPVLHGRGCRRRGPDRRRAPAARPLARLARAGDRRLEAFRLPPRRGRKPGRHGAAPHAGLPRPARGQGLCRAEPAPDVPQPAGPAAPRAAFGRAARPDLVGCRLERHGGMGRQARHEPAELDPQG